MAIVSISNLARPIPKIDIINNDDFADSIEFHFSYS